MQKKKKMLFSFTDTKGELMCMQKFVLFQEKCVNIRVVLDVLVNTTDQKKDNLKKSIFGK